MMWSGLIFCGRESYLKSRLTQSGINNAITAPIAIKIMAMKTQVYSTPTVIVPRISPAPLLDVFNTPSLHFVFYLINIILCWKISQV